MDRIGRQLSRARSILGMAVVLWGTTVPVPADPLEGVTEGQGGASAEVRGEAERREPTEGAAAETDLIPEPVSGVGQMAVEGEEGRFSESYFSMMAKLGVGLGLVVLLAWGTIYLLRLSRLGQQFGATGGLIRVAERVYLGPKKFICLVEVGGRALALGVTEERIAVLAEWPAGELDLASPPQASGSFAAHLLRFIGQVKNQPVREEGGPI